MPLDCLIKNILHEGVSMQHESHVLYDGLVHIGSPSVGGVVSELSRADGVESANSAQKSGSSCEFFVDQSGDRFQHHQPRSLDVVHFWLFN